MSKLSTILTAVFKSVALRYLIIRYLAYGIQFLNTIVLLRYLGDYDYGLYSFSLLVVTYLSYANLGLNQSVNTILSVKKDKTALIGEIWSNALTLNLIIVIIVFAANIVVLTSTQTFLAKYEYNNYGIYYVLIGLIANLNLMYTSLYRIFNQYNKINFNQFVPPFFTFIIAIILKDKLELPILFIVISAAYIVSFLWYTYNPPLRFKIKLRKSIAKNIIFRGINLMLYHFSFQYITMTAVTFVSIFYSPENLGHFSLSVSISNAFVMLITSILFIIYPKILNRLSTTDTGVLIQHMQKIKETYVVCSDIIIVCGIIISIVSSQLLPSYATICKVVAILLIGQLFNNNIVGISTALIAHKKEKSLTTIGLVSIVAVLIVCFVLGYSNAPYIYMAFSVMIGMMIYSVSVLFYAIRLWPNVRYALIGLYKNNVKFAMIVISILSCFIHEAPWIFGALLLLLLCYYVKINYNSLKPYTIRIIKDNSFFNI